jgi:hypothetical protein
MKKVLLLGLVVMLVVVSLARIGNTAPVTAQEDDEEDELYGACAELTLEVPYSEECDAEIAANPFPADEIEHAIEYDEARDGKAHPRSIFIPEEPFKYPIAWQKRAWYFADGPGVLPAADDWTNERRIGKYTMYYIFKTFKVGSEVWHLIGPNQWMNQEFVSVLQIPETPEEIEETRWVAIDLRQQTAVVFDEENTPVFATLVSTGYWFPTPEGLFHVYARTLSTTLIGPPGADPPVYVLPATPWVLFYHEHRALHGAAFHNYLGIKRSHGSINLAPGDAEWVWNYFAETEDVWDPPNGENFFVDNLDDAPWVYVYNSEEIPVTPEW